MLLISSQETKIKALRSQRSTLMKVPVDEDSKRLRSSKSRDIVIQNQIEKMRQSSVQKTEEKALDLYYKTSSIEERNKVHSPTMKFKGSERMGFLSQERKRASFTNRNHKFSGGLSTLDRQTQKSSQKVLKKIENSSSIKNALKNPKASKIIKKNPSNFNLLHSSQNFQSSLPSEHITNSSLERKALKDRREKLKNYLTNDPKLRRTNSKFKDFSPGITNQVPHTNRVENKKNGNRVSRLSQDIISRNYEPRKLKKRDSKESNKAPWLRKMGRFGNLKTKNTFERVEQKNRKIDFFKDGGLKIKGQGDNKGSFPYKNQRNLYKATDFQGEIGNIDDCEKNEKNSYRKNYHGQQILEKNNSSFIKKNGESERVMMRSRESRHSIADTRQTEQKLKKIGKGDENMKKGLKTPVDSIGSNFYLTQSRIRSMSPVVVTPTAVNTIKTITEKAKKVNFFSIDILIFHCLLIF